MGRPRRTIIKNFRTEQECIDFICDLWEITIVPSTDPKAQEFLTEERSHKEDNEKVAPRDEFNKEPRYVKNSPHNEIEVPKRAIVGKDKPNENGTVWGLVDKDEIDTYEKSTPDIERYKELKADAERERDNARYYNNLAKQSDDLASDIVRDKKLDRAKRMLQDKQIFNVEEKKTESTDDYEEGSELRIEFWETESDREHGFGEIYKYYPESQKQEAIREAEKLMHRMDYASVEVYNTKTERTEFWTDGVDYMYFGNKSI